MDQVEERVLTASKSKINLLQHLNPAEEPFSDTVLLVVLWIKSGWASSLGVFPGSPVDRDITFNPSLHQTKGKIISMTSNEE